MVPSWPEKGVPQQPAQHSCDPSVSKPERSSSRGLHPVHFWKSSWKRSVKVSPASPSTCPMPLSRAPTAPGKTRFVPSSCKEFPIGFCVSCLLESFPTKAGDQLEHGNSIIRPRIETWMKGKDIWNQYMKRLLMPSKI